MALEPSLNFCGLAQARQELSNVCETVHADLLKQDPENADISNFEELVCFYNSKMVEVYDDICGNDMTWDDAVENIDFEDFDTIKDILCIILKPLYEMDGKDLSDDCANIDEDVQTMSMPVAFTAEIGSQYKPHYAFPLLTALKNLETMNFVSFAYAARSVMDRFGIYNMNALTGLNIANNLRDAVLSLPSGFSLKKFDLDVHYEKDNFFCDNGNVKRQCRSWDCNSEQCPMTDEEKLDPPSCKPDECNNCKGDWFNYVMIEEENQEPFWEKVEFECRSCGLPDSIENGFMFPTTWSNNNLDKAYYGCNDGFKLTDCRGSAWCDIADPTRRQIPSCEVNECELPVSIEHGYMDNSWIQGQNEGCPWATYLCDEGYEIEGSASAYCRDGKAPSSVPVCVEVCVFPQFIDYGMNMLNSTNNRGKGYSRYQCSEGMKLSGEQGRYGRCVRENKDGVDVVSAYTPSCITEEE